MKICLDIRYKTESGGSMYVKQIANKLLSLDKANSYVICKYRDQSLEFEKMASDVIISPRWPNALVLLWTIAVLPFKLRQRNVDIHHGLKVPVPYWNTARTITTMHSTHDNYKGEHYVKPIVKAYFFLYANRIWKPATAVIAVSNFIKECLTEHHHVPAEKVHVIYHGIAPEYRLMTGPEIEPVLKKYSLNPGYIVCVGNVTVVKNHITVVKALAEIADETTAPLVILGATRHRNSNYARVAETVEKLGLNNRVRFLDFLPSGDVAAILNGARVMVVPSLNEGFGLVLIEGFKCGVPVIASAVTTLAELGAGRALMFDNPLDYKTLAVHIKNILMSDELYNHYRRLGLKAAEDFSWEKSALAHIDVYNWCFNKSK